MLFLYFAALRTDGLALINRSPGLYTYPDESTGKVDYDCILTDLELFLDRNSMRNELVVRSESKVRWR